MGPPRVLASLRCLRKNSGRLSDPRLTSCNGRGESDFRALSCEHAFSTDLLRGRQVRSSREKRSQAAWSSCFSSKAAQGFELPSRHDQVSVLYWRYPSACVRLASGGERACLLDHKCWHNSGRSVNREEKISVTFVNKDGEEDKIQVPVGMSMLEAAHENGIELEGACEGSLACSTCHVIVMEEDMYNRIPEPSDEENDMLDLAFGLTETSRLGCQVIAKPELDGLQLALPAATRNFAVDGHVPKPH